MSTEMRISEETSLRMYSEYSEYGTTQKEIIKSFNFTRIIVKIRLQC